MFNLMRIATVLLATTSLEATAQEMQPPKVGSISISPEVINLRGLFCDDPGSSALLLARLARGVDYLSAIVDVNTASGRRACDRSTFEVHPTNDNVLLTLPGGARLYVYRVFVVAGRLPGGWLYFDTPFEQYFVSTSTGAQSGMRQ